MRDKARNILKKYFGYDKFRPLQAEAITAALSQKDALILMPTGGGKSICYQIPAMMLQGTTIVVSPLIALMKDQVESLVENGIPASFLNSSLSSKEQQNVLEQLKNGKLRLLYISPEKLLTRFFFNLIRELNISLFAIDEAHCISSWGHDFRPEYTKLYVLKKYFPQTPVMALTATADKITRKDIVKQLQLDNPEWLVASFNRPNLSLKVLPGQKKFEYIADFVKNRPDNPGIIYCLSRKSTEQLSQKLRNIGILANYYHAGLAPNERSRAQEDFINDRVQVICATIAFGMGIDKSNVRWIIHYNMPKNLESYYQEIGRAGRDSLPAETVLFYSYADVMTYRHFFDESERREVEMAKMKRIQEYAESMICRRKILMNYFGEELNENCGNCDVCKNPPEVFNGKIIAQKALSAVYRLNEKVGMNMLIDVLRGSGRREVFHQGFHKIKTYGAGKDISFDDWQQFIIQLIHLGLLEVAYDEKNVLKLTPASKQVLFNGKKVELVKVAAIREDKKQRKKQASKRPKTHEELIFDALRKVRLKIAEEKGIPPYVIFTDTTLSELVKQNPLEIDQLEKIEGMSEQKINKYGGIFLKEIKKVNDRFQIKKAGNTHKLTKQYLEKGWTIDKIAAKRGLAETTIYSHIAHLYEKGDVKTIEPFITKQELEKVLFAIANFAEDTPLKEIYEYLEEKIDYYKIRLGISYYKVNEKNKKK